MSAQQALPSEAGAGTANDRLKRSFSSFFWGGIVAAAVLHFLVFSLWPNLHAQNISMKESAVETITLPPEVKIPPAPQAIARPAMPVIATATVKSDVTIAPTTFEQNQVANLPPPPKHDNAQDVLAKQPTFTPYTVAPQLLNPQEVTQSMERNYPPLLRDAGIGGNVVVWFFIDAQGQVIKHLINQTSGHPQLDSAAIKVADVARFSPALNYNKHVPVWIQLPITFQVSH